MMSSCGVYLHIPFCLRKCPYCDFYSLMCGDDIKAQYVNALISDIRARGNKDIIVDTVYFGGGTPTTLTSVQLCNILCAVRDSFSVSDDAEITTEANPCTVKVECLGELVQAGFNRISLGVQSCNDSELEALGRLHSFRQAKEAVYNAYRAGFRNISCDLMLGIIGQTEQSLLHSIDTLCGMPVTHISAYMLKIEEGTPYDRAEIRNKTASDDDMAELYLSAVQRLENHGFFQYEISNFCKDGMRSRHNMKYWSLEDYLGFGSSAHSFFGGKRFYYDRDIAGYISDCGNTLSIEDNAPDALTEYTMLSLRTTDGINSVKFAELGGDIRVFEALTDSLSKHGMAARSGDNMRLTPKGFLISNSIIVQLLRSGISYG